MHERAPRPRRGRRGTPVRQALPVPLALALLGATCGEPPSMLNDPPPPLPCAPVADDLGRRAWDHAAELVSFGERWPGSPGWERGLDYIAEQLERATGIEPVRDRWTDAGEEMTFENVWVTIPGAGPDRIVLGAHHDTKRFEDFVFVGANDNASGTGLLLALAEELAEWAGRASLQLVFFDGEESLEPQWNEDRALFGSKRFVRQEDAPRPLLGRGGRIRAMVLLDMVGARDLQIDEEEYSTPELVDVFRRAAEGCDVEEVFFQESMPIKDDHVPFLEAGIPAIDLIDLVDNPRWHTRRDVLKHLSADSLQIVGRVVLTALPEIERRWVPARGRLDLPGEAR